MKVRWTIFLFLGGFAMLALSMPYFAPTLEHFFEQGYGAVSAVMRAGLGG